MATVAQLDVRIGADIQSFQQGMAKMQNQLAQVGSNLRNTGRQLSTAITLPILGIGAAAVKAASDAEEMKSKFNTVFKTVGGDVTKQLDAFARASGRSRYELQGMAAQLGDIFKPLGYTEQEAGNLSVQVSKLAVDLGSFNNMPMDEALARLRGTLVGSHENALAFGVVINEASLKQELMRMGADKLTGAQLNQAKVQARLNLLMQGTTDAQGDAIRTSDSFANQFLRLKNATYDLGVTIGELLLPYANQLVGRLQGMVDYVQNLNPETKKLGIIIAGVAAAAGPLIFTLGGMASGFSAIMRAVTLTMGLFNPYVAGLAAVSAILVGLYRGSDNVQAAFKQFGTEIKNSFAPAWDTLKAKVTEVYGQFVGWWETNGETVKTTLSTTFGGLILSIGGALGAIADVFKAAWDAAEVVTEAALGENGTLAGLISSGVANGINTLAASIALIGSTIDTSLSQATAVLEAGTLKAEGGTWYETWKRLQDAPWNNLEAVKKFFETIDTDITAKIDPNTGKNAGKAAMGEDQPVSFVDAIKSAIDNAILKFDEFATGVKDPLVNDVDSVVNTAGDAADAVGNIKNTVDGLALLKPSFGNLKSPITEVKDEAKLAHDYTQQMLKSLSPEELAKIKTDPEKVEEIAALFAMMAPKELDPDQYKDLIKNLTPTDEQVENISRYSEGLRLLGIDVEDAAGQSANLAHHFGNVEDTLKLLKVDEDSAFFRFVEGLRYGAEQTTIFLEGMKSLIELLKAETWINFFDTITGIVRGLGGLIGIAGSATENGARTVAIGIPSTGAGTGVPDFTGGDPGITIPGGGAGTAAGGGAMAGLLTGMTWAGGAAIIGAGINQLIQNSRIQDPWVQLGMTRAEWMQMNIESGANAAYVQALTGGGAGLTSLIGGTGGTPSWLSGLQGYIGGAPAVGMGMTSGGQTINVNLDGQTIAQATMPYWSQELEIYGTNR